MIVQIFSFFFFFFNDTATTEIYTLSLHDALPISSSVVLPAPVPPEMTMFRRERTSARSSSRSEEHTSELQSPDHLVCRLLLAKKKNRVHTHDDQSHQQNNSRC